MVRLEQMQALVVRRYGPPEEYAIGELPIPVPGAGQIQVRVAAASINPADIRLPGGDFRDVVDLPFPHVPGNDFAGTVSAVGPGVTAFREGDEIFGQAVPRAIRHLAGSTRPSLSTGSLAQYAVFEADTPFLAHRPPGLGLPEAAALPTVGLTARALLANADLRPGTTVLVVGASGGVGTAVLPLLSAHGARVIATATEPDAAVLRSLGATELVGYGDYPTGVDLALNLVLPSDRLDDVAKAVRPGGRLLTITYPVPQPRDDVDLRFVLDMDGHAGGMREVGADAVDGDLRATIGRRYTLDQAPQALVAFVRSHTLGKLVITL